MARSAVVSASRNAARDPATGGHREALCATGNSYLAIRGAAPEARADSVH